MLDARHPTDGSAEGLVPARRTRSPELAQTEPAGIHATMGGFCFALLDKLPNPIWCAGADGKRSHFNKAWLIFTGRLSTEGNGDGWAEDLHPDDREEHQRLLQKAMAARAPFVMEYRLHHHDGAYHLMLDHGQPYDDADGCFVGYIGSCFDITERRILERELAQAQKLESIGQLAAGIAHEINTPTQFVGDNTRFLEEAFKEMQGLLKKYAEVFEASRNTGLTSQAAAEIEAAIKAAELDYLLEEVPRAIQQSLEGVQRVAKIVRAMKEFSHPPDEERAAVDINRAIESTITVARNEWKYVSDVVTDLDPELPLVPCLAGDINQVVLNILVNAAHAIADVVGDGSKGKGTIAVSTRHAGDWAEIRIRDSGTGIPEKIQSRVFDPFFTTKEVGKGTGQGLAIAHSVVVEKHGGTLSFETAAGAGTTFIIRLPLHVELANAGDAHEQTPDSHS